MKGKIIVFEGIDGAGGETQSKMLCDYLKSIGKPVEKFHYPDYFSPMGKLIKDFLYKRFELKPEVQFLMFFADFLKDSEKVKQLVDSGKTVIMDRYLTTTLAYQSLYGFSLKKALQIATLFDLRQPDIIIYLKISPETSYKRKLKEKSILDRHELDRAFQGKICKIYEKLIKGNVFGKWVVIDGEKSKEEVFAEVRKHLNL